MPATEVFAAGLTVLLTFAPAAGPHQAFAAKCPNADTAPATRNREAITRATLCLVNAERRSRGLRILRSSPRLSRAARRHARDMVRRHYFSHTAPGGVTLARRIGRTGYFRTTDTWFVGETLAWGTEARGTAHSVLRAWVHSRQHRKVLVGRSFRDIGVGVALGVPRRQLTGGATYAVDFGSGTDMPGGPVLFAYDGSPQAREAIRQARWLLRNGRNAIVLTVWGLLSTVPFAGAPGVPPVGVAEGLERKARRLADEGARLARANGFEAEAVAEEGGSAWHRIVDAADKYEASVVVMGSHGRTGIRLMLLGSVAAAVARHTERPVLIAHDGASAEGDSAPFGEVRGPRAR